MPDFDIDANGTTIIDVPQQTQPPMPDIGHSAAAQPPTPEPAGALPPELESLAQAWGQEFTQAWTHDPHSEQTMQALHGVLQKHWGDSYRDNLNGAKELVKTYGLPGLRQVLNDTGLGNDPSLIHLMGGVYAEMSRLRAENAKLREGMPVPTSPSDLAGHQQAALVASLDEQIRTAQADPAYWDESHMGHKAAVARVEALYRKRYPG